MTLYHGGYPRLRIGDLVLPPSETYTKIRLSKYFTPEAAANGVVRKDRIYVTSDRTAAHLFALAYPGGGAVYEVEPQGDLEEDPDATGAGYSWRCESAKVLRIVRVYTRREHERQMRELLATGWF